MDKETLSNYGWIVICVLVLAVMIALATPFGSYVSDAVKSTTQGLFDINKNALNSTGLINIEDQSFSDGTGDSGGGNQTTEVNREAGSVIPDGATYTPNVGTALIGNGTNTFPETPQTGDTYEEGDYTYKYNQYYNYNSWSTSTSQNGWGVRVKDTTKTKYGTILSEIAGQPVKNMSYTFFNCTSLTTAQAIPNGVTDMSCTFRGCTSITTAPDMSNASSVTRMFYTFSGCTSLTTAPVIPNSVTDMDYTFLNCTSLTTAPDMSNANSVTNMTYTFYNCTSLTTAPEIPSSVTNMFGTFGSCTSLTTAPTIPNSVTSMWDTFYGCSSLKTYVGSTDTDGDFSNYIIPRSVTKMCGTFQNCTSLTTAPAIPNRVTDMANTFNGCTSLTGIIEVNANPTSYYDCLKKTQITAVTGSCKQDIKDALMAKK